MEKLGENARRYVEEVLDLEKVADQYTQFIEEPEGVLITEDVLDIIRQQEILGRQYTEEQVKGLAKTLAYCIK